MAEQITIPRLDWSMEEGVFVEWLKQDGDAIEVGEPLFSLETEKAIQEIESIDAGILRILPDGPQPGDTIPVNTIIGFLVEPGEAVPDVIEQTHGDAPHDDDKNRGSVPTTSSAMSSRQTANQDQSAAVSNSAATQRTFANTATAATQSAGLPKISPRATRVAAELDVDWSGLTGSGSSGRIREQDIRAAASQLAADSVESASSTASPVQKAAQIIPITQTRRIIAERMTAGTTTAAPVTLTTTADATQFVSLRRQFQSAAGQDDRPVPGYTDIVIKLAAAALGEHPLLHARWEERGIVVPSTMNIGFAVDTDTGLIAPVIQNADSLSLREIACRAHDLAHRARSRELKAEETRHGTFTVTNLGPYGIDAFTPIINVPETAILGLGRIERRAIVQEDQIVARDMITLSLTFDHRIVDGAPAARFLQTIRGYIENPVPRIVP
jgi:pyruvate dehydrogenase E2 component (dihydrolipoamide acetyltransferase)